MSISDVRKRIAEEEKRRSTSSLANAQQNDSVHDRVAKIKSAATLYDAEDIGYGTDERIDHVNKNLYQPNNQRDMRLTAQGLAHLGKRAGSVINTLGIYSNHFGEAGKIAQERAGVANSPAAKQAQAMARARSGDMNVLSGLDEDDPNYALYKRLLRLSGYDDVTRAYGATELPEELTREGVSTYGDLFDRQRDYDSNQMGRDLQDVEFLSQGAGDSQRYLDASGRLQDYFGGDWSADAVNERMQSGGAGWYQELLKQYGLDTQALRDAYPLDDKDHDYDGYVRYMQDLAKQKQEQDAMLARYNEWKAYYDGKWGGLSSEPDYAQYTGEIVDPATYYPQQMMPETLVAGYDYMTDEEKRNFTYLLKNPAYDDAGDDGAEQYLKDLQEELWRRRITAKNENLAEFTDKNALTGALGWVGARVSNLANAAMGAGNAINAPLHAMFGEEISPYDPSFDYARYTQAADTVNAQNINEATQWAQIGRFNPFNIAYSGASAAADSILSGLAFGPGGGAAAQAFGAGNTELMQGIEAGDRPFADVVMDAIATGAFEGLTEKFSMDALFKGGTSAAKNIARSMLTEPSEEIANMLLNLGYDRLRYGTDDDLGRRMNELVTQGYTESEARVQLLKELGGEALETILTAMVAGGAGGTVSAASTHAENKGIGKQIQENETTARLLEIAEGMQGMPKYVRALIEDQKAAVQAAQEAQRAAETQDEEMVEEEPEVPEAAQEAVEDDTEEAAAEETTDTAEDVAPKKPDTKKKKTPQLNNAKLGRIYRETMSRLDEQAQNVLADTFGVKTMRRLIDQYSALDRVQADGPMRDVLAKTAAKAVANAASLTDEELNMLRSSKAASTAVREMTAAVIERGEAQKTAAELMGMATKGGAQLRLMTELPEELASDGRTLKQYSEDYGKQGDIMLDAYESHQDVGQYAQQFRAAFNYGRDGRNVDSIIGDGKLTALTEKQIRTAYELGRDVRKQNVAIQRKANPAGVTVGNVDRSAIAGMQLNSAQHTSVTALTRMAKIMDFNLKLVASTANAEGKYTTENGSWDRNTRTLTIDINAGRLSTESANYAMMQTAGHELTHYIKQFANSELYDEYQEFVLGHLSKKMGNTSLNARIASVVEGNAKQGKTLTREQAIDEIVADASGDALLGLTEADLAEMAQKKPGLLKAIGKFFEKWINSIKTLIRKGYEGQTARNAVAEQMVDVAEELGRKWAALLKNAQANAAEADSNADPARNTEAFYDSSEAILNQARPPYTDGTKLCTEFVESLAPEARETYDLLYNFYQASRYGRKNLSSKFMYWSEWNDMVNGSKDIAAVAKRMAASIPAKVRKAMNMDENGLLTPTTLEQEFRMSRSMGQRIIDALGDKGVEAVETTYTIDGTTYELSSGNGMTAVGGEAYRRALCNEVRRAYREGKLKQANISTLSKDNWGSMGFLASNGKTGASGDFTTLCPQMYFNRGCHYCYRLAALKSGVNNKLVGVNVWYGGEILRMKDKDVDMLNRNGGLRIQSFGDWMPQYSSQLADMLYDADLRGLQIKIITKEPSMIEYVAKLKEQGLGKSLYFNLSCDYAIERAAKKGTPDYVPMNPERPFMFDDEGNVWWKRAMAVQEANRYRTKYPWVNTCIVATTLDEFIRGLKDPKVDVVTGYHGNIREWERIDSETGNVLVNVEALGDAGMPRFFFNPETQNWSIEYAGKTATHKRLAEAIAREGLEYEYYIKTCCITGRCATCSGKCGALAKDFNIKNATNRDAESVAYWQSHMISAATVTKPSVASEAGAVLAMGEGFASDDGISYSVREGADPKTSAQAYKLFNVDENGLPHALFIDAANALELGTWYDADSPLIKDMEDLEPGATYYIDRDGNAELRRFNNKAQSPSKSDLEEAAREGGRFIYVGVYKDAKRKGQKSYANWGLNGSGQISTFAMRPGWHMTNVPAARHIGAGRNGGEAMYRRPNQRWFLVEYATDVDYNNEAAQNPTKDIATHIPTDGWYSFRTNTNAEADQDWIISGALKIVRPVSEREAHRIAQEAGVPEDLPYKDGVKAFAEDDVVYHVREAKDDDSVNLQIRDPYQLTDREILANTMESVARNKDELDILRRYKARVAEYGEKQALLDKINANIARLTNEGGERDEIVKERNRAQILRNQIDRLDQQLAHRERTEAVKALAGRERQRVRAEQQKTIRTREVARLNKRLDDEKAKYDRMQERYQKQLAEQKQKVHDVREEKNESFARTKYLGEVQKHSKRLIDLLTTPTNKAYVPEFLRRPLADFITALDFRSVTQLEGGEATKGDERMKDAMAELSSALRKAHTQQFGENTTGAEFFSGYLDLPGDFLDTFDELMAKIRVSLKTSPAFAATPVNKMTSEQLHDLAKVFRLLHSSIVNMNRLISNAKYASAVTAANDTMTDLEPLKDKRRHSELAGKVSSFLDWKNTVPYYVFKRFGRGGMAIFEGLMDGWDKLAHNSDELVKFTDKAYNVSEVREWEREVHTVELASGNTVSMTTAQMMSVYCLAKREQARGHLLGGGIRIADIGSRGKVIRQVANHLLTDADLKAIAKQLTPRQREVADALQGYMNTKGSEWGNYVSMKRFGYEMFTEEHYFPIETDPNNRAAQDEKSEGESLYRLLNMSATKGLTKGANNAIVVRSIFDVFTAHMTDMAKYNALGLQLLDTFKWFNYVERTQNKDGTVETRTTQKALEEAYGGDARSYIMQFLRDLNGVSEGGREDGFINKATSNYKIASTAANLRVGILQITSMPRAAYVINPKYLAVGLAKWNTSRGKNSAKAAEEVGIAKWKSMGFYDTNINRSVRKMVKHDENWREKAQDWSTKLAEWGDAWTMGVLYGAVEAEMKDKHPSVQPGSKAYRELFNRRMREIVYQTQVVDSTMTRSQLMRSKGLITLATSFMSEPTLAMNMLNDAIFEARVKARAGKPWFPAAAPKVARAFGTTTFVIGLSSVVEALFTAYRDDDEFETFAEKLTKAFFGESFWDGALGGNLNLLNNLPLIKDVIAAAQGDTSDAMYSAWAKTMYDGLKTLYTVMVEGGNDADIYRGVYKTVNGMSQLTGIAAGGAMREFVALYNTFVAEPYGWERLQTHENTPKDAAKAIYAASLRGDADMVKFYRERAAMYGIGESKISKALVTLIEEELKAGNIDSATARKLLTGEAGKSADYTSDLINDAQYELDTGLDFDNLRDDYAAGVLSESQVRNYLVKYGGKSTEEIEDTMSRYDYYIATGKTTTPPKYWRIAYAHETGGNYRRLAEDAMVSIIAGGRTEKQARRQIADSLESYYKDEYLSIAGTPAGDRMLEDILDVYEAIGYTREYERNYINENWFD